MATMEEMVQRLGILQQIPMKIGFLEVFHFAMSRFTNPESLGASVAKARRKADVSHVAAAEAPKMDGKMDVFFFCGNSHKSA